MASILQSRDLICQNIASLAARQQLDRNKTQNVLQLIQLTSRARHAVDGSAGVLPLLQHLLTTKPQAFIPPGSQRLGGQGGGGTTMGRGRGGEGGGGGPPPSVPTVAGLVQHLAADESACYTVTFVTPQGVESIWCNERMADLFISTEGMFFK